MPKLAIYGASGQARALVSMIVDIYAEAEIVGFIDDMEGDRGQTVDDVPVISFETWRAMEPRPPIFISLGRTSDRRRLAARVEEAGGTLMDFRPLMAQRFPRVTLGLGSLIGIPSYVGPNTTIGRNIQVMPMCSVGHDVVIGDNCILCPSATISGYVVLEDGVFVGAGSTIINGRPGRPLVIGRDATIATGAVVTKSVPPGVAVMGNPARPLRELARDRRKG
nr:hypothetical protein [Ancylobacter gelatini]